MKASRGGRPGLSSLIIKPNGFCGRKGTLHHHHHRILFTLGKPLPQTLRGHYTQRA